MNNSMSLNLREFQPDYRDIQNEFRKQKEFIDVQLQIGDKLFDAHRAALSVYSPVLKAMLSEQWSTTKICPISEEFVEAEIMEDLLEFLYTGSIELTPDNVHPVCVAAHFLQIQLLLEHSVQYLCHFITPENVLTLFRFSLTCDLDSLKYSCFSIIKANYETLFRSLQILEFSFKDFNDLIVGLNEKYCDSRLRENTFHCIVRWAEKNRPERLDELPVLLKNIPLEELPLEFLEQTVFIHPLVLKSVSCFETVSNAYDNYQTYQKLEPKQNLIVIRDPDWRINRQYMECYDSQTRIWRQILMPSLRINTAVTVLNQQDIVVCGGYVDERWEKVTSSVEMFEWSKQTWRKLPDMPVAFSGMAIAALNDCLYVSGGEPARNGMNGKFLSSVLCYSFKTMQWKYVAPMHTKQIDGTLISYKNLLFNIHGLSYNVEMYDPTQNVWTMMAKGEECIFHTSATLHQGKIYIAGYSSSMVYDPETKVFEHFPSLPLERESLVSMNDRLLAVGGCFSNNSRLVPSDLIYEFDFTTHMWRVFDEMTPQQVHQSTGARRVIGRTLAAVGNFF